MIDVHTHLLPGVDDGSPSIGVSVPILERFAAEGVTDLVCTPHLMASRALHAPRSDFHEKLEELQAAVPSGPRLHLGWEIMLDAPGVDLTDPALGLAGRHAILVEFHRGQLPAGASEELGRLLASGRRPVLAHPERYPNCTLELIRAWRALGVVIQTDARSLLGKGLPSSMARAMLAHGLIDVLASDNHGDARRSLALVRDWLVQSGGAEQARLLTQDNPACLLTDRSLADVPPMRGGARGLRALWNRLWV